MMMGARLQIREINLREDQMKAFTMNHLSTDALNELNDRERQDRHHHDHVDELRFVLSLAFALGVIVGAMLTL